MRDHVREDPEQKQYFYDGLRILDEVSSSRLPEPIREIGLDAFLNPIPPRGSDGFLAEEEAAG